MMAQRNPDYRRNAEAGEFMTWMTEPLDEILERIHAIPWTAHDLRVLHFQKYRKDPR